MTDMLNSFKKHWLVIIEEKGSGDIIPRRETFVCRDWNAWKAFDAIKAFCAAQKKKSGNEWDVISMTRL